MKTKPRHALQPIETALKHWPRTTGLFCSQRRLPHGEHPSYVVRTSSQMEETKCNSHSGLTEGGQRHSCRQQQGLRDEGLNHTCGPNSNADNRPPPSRTNVHELCTMGTSPSQRNAREPLTPGSTCHHLPTHTPPLTPIPIHI